MIRTSRAPALALVALAFVTTALTGCATTGGLAGSDGGPATPTATPTSASSGPGAVAEPAEPNPAGTPAPGTTPDPAGVQAAVAYATVEDLRSAVSAAGYPCDEWQETGDIDVADGSGWCGLPATLGLSVYHGRENRDVVLARSASSIEPGAFLAGPNWLITVAEGPAPDILGTLQDTLGGELRPRG